MPQLISTTAAAKRLGQPSWLVRRLSDLLDPPPPRIGLWRMLSESDVAKIAAMIAEREARLKGREAEAVA